MEQFDVVDELGRPTGEIVTREAAHREGIRHRTAHVWLVRERDGRPQVLLQKRSMNKDSFPGRLDTSSAGHIPAGCEPVDSALRELQEELGVTARPEELTPAGKFDIGYDAMFHGRLFRDREVSFVYVLFRDVPEVEITIQQEELESVVWQDFAAVLAAVGRHDPSYCVPSGGLACLRETLRKRYGQI